MKDHWLTFIKYLYFITGTLHNHELQKCFTTVLTDQGDTASDMICQLGKLFYNLGWVSGTGGGISIRNGQVKY